MTPRSLAIAAGRVLTTLVLLGGTAIAVAVGASQEALGDRVTAGVSAFGIPLGGLTAAEAEALLAPQADAILDRPLRLRAGERTWDLTARRLGLRLDAAAVARDAQAVGRGGELPTRLAEQVAVRRFGRDVGVEPSLEPAAMDGVLADIAAEVERPLMDAWLELSPDGTVRSGGSQAARALDLPASRARVAAALAGGRAEVELVVRETAPSVVEAQVAGAEAALRRALEGPQPRLALTFRERAWRLGTPDVASLLRLEPPAAPGAPYRVAVDDEIVRAYVFEIADAINQEGQEPRIAWNGGKLAVLRESRETLKLDGPAAAALIRERVLAGGGTASLPVDVVKPGVSSEDLGALGIVELIDRGTTSFAGSTPEKAHNIRLAAKKLNGVVVPPGGTFSFNREIGPTTLDAGFTWGFGIAGGEQGVQTIPSVAGGICQVATTLFQPVFWAGFPLEERHPHLYWIPAYASRGVVGLDVTVDEDARLDFQWTNPTDSPILIEATTTADTVQFALYGRKPGWSVKVDPAKVTNRTPPDPTPVRQEEPLLARGRSVQVESAREGFEVVVTRTVAAGGEEPRVLNLRTVYQPSRNVTLVGTGGERPVGPS